MNQNLNQEKSDYLDLMPYNISTIIPGDTEVSVRLKCANLRIAFLALSLVCWIFILVFLCEMAAHSAIPKLAENARAVNDFFDNSTTFMTGPVIITGTLLYFIWSRKTLTWFNGVVIDDKPVAVIQYQFKKMSPGIHIIYLRSAGRLWIVCPGTSQDNMRFKNIKILKEETAYNETQVELLKEKLIASDAVEKKFWFLTWELVISIAILTLIMIVALSDSW